MTGTAAGGSLLRIYLSESDHWEGRPLYDSITRECLRHGLAGVTVLRGIDGFGADSHLHRRHLFPTQGDDLPVIVEILDSAENINRIVPRVEAMVADGLIITQAVGLKAYNHPTKA